MNIVRWVMHKIKVVMGLAIPLLIRAAVAALAGDRQQMVSEDSGWAWSPEGGWECMSCHRTRADRFITVTHLPIPGMENWFPGTRINYRHCNDTPTCRPTKQVTHLRHLTSLKQAEEQHADGVEGPDQEEPLRRPGGGLGESAG